MGYTHYWNTEKCTKDARRLALVDCAAIVMGSPVPLAGWDGSGEPKLDLDEAVVFNGAGDEDQHETFALGLEPSSFEFCKTQYKPYDIVVVACLCALADRAGPSAVSSDGDVHEWEAGRALAEKVLGRPIANHIGEEED